ncbi:MAG: MarR family winged helix-turn-helix transcriptional regulator [Phototrophicaceae bacterium]|jgi:DNA-binding MarR family transcriptional regulator
MTDTLPPTTLHAWRLFLTAHRLLIADIDRRLAAAEQIPLNWYDVLIELYEAPDQKLRMADLAQRVLLTRSGLTRLVDQLEAKGYLRRELDPDDRRGFYAILTDAGVAAMRAAWPIYAAGIQQLFGSHLSAEEAAVLVRLFERMGQ